MEEPTTKQPAGRAAGARRQGPPARVLAASLIAVAAIVYLVVSGMRGAALYSLTIPELYARGPAAVGQGVRVSGTLEEPSVVWDAQNVRLSFTLTDGGEALPIVHRGAKPDMFRDGAEVIVEGKLGADGIFDASKLLLKCPSKYEAEDTGS